MTRVRTLILGALVVALAACGSSGGSKDSTSGSSRTSATTQESRAADRRLARAALIRRTDLPGWEVSRGNAGGVEEIKDLAAGIPGCETLVAGLRDGLVHLRSARYSQDGTTVRGSVDVYATKADLEAQLELYRDPGVITCLQNLYTKALQTQASAGETVDSVSVSPIAVEEVGDGAYGFRLTATLTQDGQPRTILSDIVGVTIGRVGASLTVTADDPADLASTESTLLPIVAQRVRNAGG